MRNFNTVVEFSENDTISKKLVDFMIDYAKQDLSEKNVKKFSYSDKYTKEKKAEIINGFLLQDLERKSKFNLKSDFGGKIEDFATHSSVQSFAQNIQKVLLDAVYPYIFDNKLFNTIAEVHYAGFGDTFQIDLKNQSLYKVSKLGRRQNHALTQEKQDTSVSINTDRYAVTTISNLPKILLGESMLAEDIMTAGMSMLAKVYELVLLEFKEKTEAVTIPALFTEGAFSEKSFLEDLKVVKSYSGNTTPLLFGDTIALKTLLPENTNTRIDLQDMYNTVGYLDMWNGHSVVGFDAVASNDGEYGILGLEQNRLYGIAPTGKKIIHVALGSTSVKLDDGSNSANQGVLNTVSQEIGVELVTNEVLAVYKVS